MFVIRKLLCLCSCLLLFCNNASYPSSSYLRTKAKTKVNAQSSMKCPTERYRTTKTKEKNTPAYSLTQKARVRGILASRGWRVVRIVRGVRTTGYSPGDGHTPGTRTACGVRAKHGVISVDPRNIRLHSHLYVPGYGFGQALDTGGRIKGKRADLCYNSVKEARKHGIKMRDIYVLERAK